MWLLLIAELCPGGNGGECAAAVPACGVQAAAVVEGGQDGAVVQEACVCGAE